MRVGTRGSALALAQTGMVVDMLATVAPGPLRVEVVQIQTRGDRLADRPISEIGTKAVFAHELQRALADGDIDVAVHSLKDLTGAEPDGLVVGAVPQREDARDVLVCRHGATLADLPAGARVGTSSARRAALLASERPDVEAVAIRGNVDTRLTKVAAGDVDAAILAAAGLVRLGRTEAITEWLDPDVFIPPPGQGALAVECRADRFGGDLGWIAAIESATTRLAVDTERTFMLDVEGSCDVPLGALATVDAGTVRARAVLAAPDGSEVYRATVSGPDAATTARDLRAALLAQGAGALLERLSAARGRG